MRLHRSAHLVWLPLVCLLLPAWPTPAAGQAAPADCPQGRISSIFVDNHSVFDTSDPDLDDRIGWAYRLANRLHVPTREEVIRREILLTEGDCFDPEMLLESERVLRASAFLAKVDIYAIPQPDGTYHIVIDTRDDWSVRLEPQTDSRDGLQLTGIELRDDNLLGYGRRVSAFYLREWDEPTYGFSYATPQLLGSRWDASLAAGKTPTGHLFSQSLSYPFIGESGRWAVRQQLQHSDRFFDYLAESDSGLVTILFPERRRSFDLGGVVRVGGRRSLTLLGAALVGEWIAYPSFPRYAHKGQEKTFAGDSLLQVPFGRDSVSSVRAMLLAGQRNVRYVRRRGFDTVRGTEDVRLGIEAEIGVGRSISALSSHSDMAIELGLFGGAEFGSAVTAGSQIRLEGKRRSDEASERTAWNDVFAQMDAWAYWRPSPESRHTLIGALAAAGGWNTTVPFQLTLGGASALRGHPRHQDPGAQRVVASVEQRSYLGWPYPQLFDLGTVAFVDVGKMWAGEVPYGIDSPVRVNLGFGLRAALPPGSRNTLRVDLAVPFQSGLSAGDLVVSAGVRQVIGARMVRTDPQLQRSSRRGVATSLFTYPN